MIRAQNKFRISQTVRLNGGSPDLEVVVIGEQTTTVEWHNGLSMERFTSPPRVSKLFNKGLKYIVPIFSPDI
jgi:hypothetical protein